MADYGNDVANDDYTALPVNAAAEYQAAKDAINKAAGASNAGLDVHETETSTEVSTGHGQGGTTTNDKFWADSVSDAVKKASADVDSVAGSLQGKQPPSATLASILKPTVTETVKTSQKRQGDLKNQKTLGLIGDALRVVTDLGTAAGGGNVILHTPFDAGAKDKEIKAEEDKETSTKTSFSKAVAQARFAEDTNKMDLFKLIFPNYLKKRGSEETSHEDTNGTKSRTKNSQSNYTPNSASSTTTTPSHIYLLPDGAEFSIDDSKSREVSEAVLNSILANPELREQAIRTAGRDLQDAFQGLLEEQGYATANAKRQASIVAGILNNDSWKEALKSVPPEKLAHINQLYWSKSKTATQFVLNHAQSNKDQDYEWYVLDEPVNGSYVGRRAKASANSVE